MTVEVPQLKKPEWPGFIAGQLGIPPVMGIAGPWQSSEGTTNVAWFRAMCELLEISYPHNRVAAMRALIERTGQHWDEASMSSAGTVSGGGGNVRKEAFEALWIGLVESALLPSPSSDPEAYSDGWHPDAAHSLPEVSSVVRNIRLRQGQPIFRTLLLDAYQGRCAVTGWDVVETLEAAHIVPHARGGNMTTSNGLLLRADIHTLFDLGLLCVDTATWTVLIAGSIRRTTRGQRLHGERFRLPADEKDRPRREALDEHRTRAGL